MDPTNPEVQNNPVENNEEQNNVQKRINELTAEKYAAAKAAEEAQKQVAQLTALVAQQMQERQTAAPEPLPEGVDPNLAKFFDSRISKMESEYRQRTEQMIWQLQHQMDQRDVNAQYAHLPESIRQDAASRLTGLKQRFGNNVSMDEAMALAYWDAQKKAGQQQNIQQQQAQQFNQMGQPLPMHGLPRVVTPQPAQNLSPAMDPLWDTYDWQEQNRRIDAWEKKGNQLKIVLK